LFVSPQKHTHPPGALSNGPEGGVVYKTCISSTSFSSNICLRCLWRYRIRESVIYLKVQRQTERSHKQLERH
jgi:hypothetical protein